MPGTRQRKTGDAEFGQHAPVHLYGAPPIAT
jgi:hypothetical protein